MYMPHDGAKAYSVKFHVNSTFKNILWIRKGISCTLMRIFCFWFIFQSITAVILILILANTVLRNVMWKMIFCFYCRDFQISSLARHVNYAPGLGLYMFFFFFVNLSQRRGNRYDSCQTNNSELVMGWVHGLGWVKDDGSPHPIRVYWWCIQIEYFIPVH